jgi:hypothetical protein
MSSMETQKSCSVRFGAVNSIDFVQIVKIVIAGVLVALGTDLDAFLASLDLLLLLLHEHPQDPDLVVLVVRKVEAELLSKPEL